MSGKQMASLSLHEARVEVKHGKEQERKVELLKNGVFTPRLSAQYVDCFFPPTQSVVLVVST